MKLLQLWNEATRELADAKTVKAVLAVGAKWAPALKSESDRLRDTDFDAYSSAIFAIAGMA